ncbi:hypothetical protein LSH36_71g02025 [Paralvinella palmiformis]|uniref:Uncharacterized protein n=1 Tax=Paralvinella palmiformis TaxID=53620 RepID=A0AAD9K2Y9_9ANNE|nr:hypothetical protein LSH36_71g02025 [Paralvinella palmiformis]
MNWLERSLNVSFTVKHVSSAVAITGCSGVKYGLGEAKLSWFLTPRQNIVGGIANSENLPVNGQFCSVDITQSSHPGVHKFGADD